VAGPELILHRRAPLLRRPSPEVWI